MQFANHDIQAIIIDLLLDPCTWFRISGLPYYQDQTRHLPETRNGKWKATTDEILWIQDLKMVNRFWNAKVTSWLLKNWKTRSWPLLFKRFVLHYFPDKTSTLDVTRDYFNTLRNFSLSWNHWGEFRGVPFVIDSITSYQVYEILFFVENNICLIAYDDPSFDWRGKTCFSLETGLRVSLKDKGPFNMFFAEQPADQDIAQSITTTAVGYEHMTFQPHVGIHPGEMAFPFQKALPWLIAPQFADNNLSNIMPSMDIRFRWGAVGGMIDKDKFMDQDKK